MGFIIAKVLLYLVLPPAGILVFVLSGFAVMGRHRRVGRSLAAAGVALLYLLSLGPVADLLIRPLESSFPPYAGTGAGAEAVVVLGGGVRDLSWVPAEPAPSRTSLERLVHAMQLARRARVPLVISGGSGEIVLGPLREADAMAATAAGLGFPSRDIVVEGRSRNTRESAKAVGELLSSRTIVLVTSAFHMKRSVRMFARQGFTVIPAPSGYLSQSRPWSITLLLPRAAYLEDSSTAIAEYLSIAWYRLTGVI